jgi:hypothetical protein
MIISGFVKLPFILLLASTIIAQEQPGLRIGISDKAIKTIEQHYIPAIIQNLTTTEYAALKFNETEEFFGTLFFQIDKIKLEIQSVDYNQLDILFGKNVIVVLLKIKLIKIDFNFLVHTNFYDNSNSASAILSNLDITFNQTLFSLQNVRSTKERPIYGPGLKFEDADLNDFDLDIQLNGNSNLENLIRFAFGSIRTGLKDTLRSKLFYNCQNN